MALDSTVLENLITKGIQDAYIEFYPDVMIDASASLVTKEDGSTEIEVTPVWGPIQPDEKAIRAMARGIARGIVEHLREHAVVKVSGITTGSSSVDAEIE